MKHGYIHQISNSVKNENLFWKKSPKKKYTLEAEELALVYYAIKKSNEYDRNNKDKIIKNSFSYKMIKKLFKVVYGTSCHRAQRARMLKILKDAGLIVKIGNYIPGVRGNCYVVAEIHELFNQADVQCSWLDGSMEEFIESLCA